MGQRCPASRLKAYGPAWKAARWHGTSWTTTGGLEIAAGFHTSTTHAGGFSIPSNLVSIDWFFNPWRRLEFSGAFFSGQNVANLGTGAIDQGYYIYYNSAEAIDSTGGWGQITLHTIRRLDFHLFTGQQDYEAAGRPGSVTRNLVYGGNLYFAGRAQRFARTGNHPNADVLLGRGSAH